MGGSEDLRMAKVQSAYLFFVSGIFKNINQPYKRWVFGAWIVLV